MRISLPTNSQQALVIKLGPKLWGLGAKLIKGAKVTKLALAGASVASYAWLYTWQFSLIIIFALVIHEWGHIVAMRQCGLRTKGIYLIPFVGGAAIADGDCRSRFDAYYIAMAGPVFGFFSAVLWLVFYWIADYPLFAGVAGWIAMLNVINLLPVNPLDGGKILKSISFSAGSGFGFVVTGVGLFGGALLAGSMGAVLLGFLIFIGIVDLAFDWKKRDQHVVRMEYLAPPIAAYIGLVCAFVWIIQLAASVHEAALALEVLKD